MIESDSEFHVRLYQTFILDDRVCFLMEPVLGGDLFWHIHTPKFSMRAVVFYAACVGTCYVSTCVRLCDSVWNCKNLYTVPPIRVQLKCVLIFVFFFCRPSSEVKPIMHVSPIARAPMFGNIVPFSTSIRAWN